MERKIEIVSRYKSYEWKRKYRKNIIHRVLGINQMHEKWMAERKCVYQKHTEKTIKFAWHRSKKWTLHIFNADCVFVISNNILHSVTIINSEAKIGWVNFIHCGNSLLLIFLPSLSLLFFFSFSKTKLICIEIWRRKKLW